QAGQGKRATRSDVRRQRPAYRWAWGRLPTRRNGILAIGPRGPELTVPSLDKNPRVAPRDSGFLCRFDGEIHCGLLCGVGPMPLTVVVDPPLPFGSLKDVLGDRHCRLLLIDTNLLKHTGRDPYSGAAPDGPNLDGMNSTAFARDMPSSKLLIIHGNTFVIQLPVRPITVPIRARIIEVS